jgi:uncharacterized protein (TIGR01319 family)
MQIDALVYEIGSTTTVVNAFNNLLTDPVFLASGMSETTTYDVSIGASLALKNLIDNLKVNELLAIETFATSSAAGGLKMSVHALVYDMTVKAGVEAALGAGANLTFATAGILTNTDLDQIKHKKINIIMIAGGVDFGEKETALKNSIKIASLKLNIPVIYAGNIQNVEEVKLAFIKNNQDKYLYITDNVYPKLDEFNVLKARVIIQNVFEEHITKSSGMEKIKSIITNKILPTPGAVMNAAILLQKQLGDLVVVDIGGATTDVSSVCNDKVSVLTPEPFIKRTVEGDLGVFVNKDNLIKQININNLSKRLNITIEELDNLINNYNFIPDEKQVGIVEILTEVAFEKAILRHAGLYKSIYTSRGKLNIAEGKDLTGAKYLIATGGALTRLPNSSKMIKGFLEKGNPTSLVPNKETIVLIDNHYIMASLGALAYKYPDAAIILLEKSLGLR